MSARPHVAANPYSLGAPLAAAWNRGYHDRGEGVPAASNPYGPHAMGWRRAWFTGWRTREAEALEERRRAR